MSRLNTSANSAMNSQMTVNQKKNTTIAHRNVPKFHCTVHLQLLIVVRIVDPPVSASRIALLTASTGCTASMVRRIPRSR